MNKKKLITLPDFKKQVEELLDDPRTGLKNSSDTNKTRHAILAIITEAWELGKKETIAEVENWAEKSLDMFEETILINFLQTLKDKE